MTDKEIRKLTRAELIEIIYQLQINQEELEKENKQLKEQLESKRIRIQNAGNLAQAVLEINHVMEDTQKAANMYLEEIREIRRETEEKCIHILEFTRKKSNEYLDNKDKYRRFD